MFGCLLACWFYYCVILYKQIDLIKKNVRPFDAIQLDRLNCTKVFLLMPSVIWNKFCSWCVWNALFLIWFYFCLLCFVVRAVTLSVFIVPHTAYSTFNVTLWAFVYWFSVRLSRVFLLLWTEIDTHTHLYKTPDELLRWRMKWVD